MASDVRRKLEIVDLIDLLHLVRIAEQRGDNELSKKYTTRVKAHISNKTYLSELLVPIENAFNAE